MALLAITLMKQLCHCYNFVVKKSTHSVCRGSKSGLKTVKVWQCLLKQQLLIAVMIELRLESDSSILNRYVQYFNQIESFLLVNCKY